MKRSEMIEEMKDFWLGIYIKADNQFVDKEDQEYVQERMSKLLKYMEDSGMLPPPVVYQDYPDYTADRPEGYFPTINAWEDDPDFIELKKRNWIQEDEEIN